MQGVDRRGQRACTREDILPPGSVALIIKFAPAVLLHSIGKRNPIYNCMFDGTAKAK